MYLHFFFFTYAPITYKTQKIVFNRKSCRDKYVQINELGTIQTERLITKNGKLHLQNFKNVRHDIKISRKL